MPFMCGLKKEIYSLIQILKSKLSLDIKHLKLNINKNSTYNNKWLIVKEVHK